MATKKIDNKKAEAKRLMSHLSASINPAKAVMGSELNAEHTMGPRTTATAKAEGRLKVDAAGAKKAKKTILKKALNKMAYM